MPTMVVKNNDSNNKLDQGLRLAAYWLTVVAFLLAWTWYPLDAFGKGKDYLDKVGEALLPAHLDEVGVGPSQISCQAILVMPVLFVTTLAALLITNTPLPTTDWLIRPFASLRTYPISSHAEEGRSIYKKAKNQFLKGPNAGQLNFHLVAILFIVIPSILQFVGWAHFRLTTKYKTVAERWWYIALLFGWAALVGLPFFLIPVTRHSVMLAAMGWSPVHALRIHVVAGWFSWWCTVIHALMYVIDWFCFHGDELLLDVIFPPLKCWTWKNPYEAFAGGEDVFNDTCVYPFFNFTGIIAGSFFGVLAASSIHWFRRRHYRIFYLFHVTFGALMLIAVVFHWPGATTLLMPSLIYYVASTSPTLIQALATYSRGGHQIVKVIDLGPKGGNCMEVHVATDATTDAALAREPCSCIKLCVPAISVVWHPFTVFRSYGGKEQDETPQKIMRILFRPVGPFTAQLARQLVASPRPIAIFDGLYSVGNHATRAMTHDHVVIVAGGVAISPYLSLIPNVLERLRVAAEKQGTAAVMTKKIVLHWACREESLIRYVRDTYLYPMLVRAHQNNNNHIVTFQVHIYRTGSVPPGHVSGPVSMDDTAAIEKTPVVVDITKTVEIVEETGTTMAKDEIMVNDDDDNCYTAKKEKAVMIKAYVTSADVNGSSSTGFAMELARMMPGRYHSVWQNLPLFAVLTVMFGTGQWIYFYFDVVQTAQAHYNPYLGAWISNFIWLAVVIGLSSIIERVAQWSSRRRYPTRMGDDQYVVCSSPVDEELAHRTKDDDDNMLMKRDESSVVVQYEEHVGRPVLHELLDEPRRVATAPAIFSCGPVAMTEALRRVAQTDDNAFGLVRFVMYEELFEM